MPTYCHTDSMDVIENDYIYKTSLTLHNCTKFQRIKKNISNIIKIKMLM
jgi:hypothetical protein